MDTLNRAGPDSVALETTLLTHGVPPGSGQSLARELSAIIERHEVRPAVVGVLRGRAIVGLNPEELTQLLGDLAAPKVNTANLGLALFRSQTAATTVSTTLELAAAAGVRIFATGGLGGVHKHYGQHLDISSDLAALTRFPVAVVASGVKSILDVAATREALETLGIPVIGFQTDSFPAFYLRESTLGVDGRFDDVDELAAYLDFELSRTGRAVVIANPIPHAEAIPPEVFESWLDRAQAHAREVGAQGRDITPAILAALHRVSMGATLAANIALVKSNTVLAAQLCKAMLKSR